MFAPGREKKTRYARVTWQIPPLGDALTLHARSVDVTSVTGLLLSGRRTQ
jgi:hypothetical protein